ncbi:MAG: hypothetical protein FWH20_03330 [Oscillospiraceae bacterium]|nr:hypothetical protein [Oscillospiraceae bacterium]
MNLRKYLSIILCLLCITTALTFGGCLEILEVLNEVLDEWEIESDSEYADDDYEYYGFFDGYDYYDFYDDYEDYSDYSDYSDSTPDRSSDNSIPSATLDKSSAKSFIASVRSNYKIILTADNWLLSGSHGAEHMNSIEYVLATFSPAFVGKFVDSFADYRYRIFLELNYGTGDAYELGSTLLYKDVTIFLHYNSDSYYNGITVGTFAHELAHAIHFLIEENIGEARSQRDMKSFNGSFDYAGDYYDYYWDESLHGTTFATDYGMSNHYEDWATIIERLVTEPDVMGRILSDTRNDPLFKKTQYIRDTIYKYISDECSAVFEPLHYAEATRRLAY